MSEGITQYEHLRETPMDKGRGYKTAFRRNQFVPFPQPKVDLATGISSCVEMLARCDHSELGILLPNLVYPFDRKSRFDY
jgi:EAL domain-containing protein (putative c-di-GMP-specific phosphodiesterase class I)